MCKPSNWDPNSLPRVAEDGGVCGRMAYYRVGHMTCTGTPSSAIGQPRHAASQEFRMSPEGRWYHDFFNSVYPNPKYVSTAHAGNEAATDEVPGIQKTVDEGIHYTIALSNAVNAGLDSFIDTRLALVRRCEGYTALVDTAVAFCDTFRTYHLSHRVVKLITPPPQPHPDTQPRLRHVGHRCSTAQSTLWRVRRS